MDKYEDFEVVLRQLVQEVCETLAKVEVPRRAWTKIVRRGDGNTSFPQQQRSDVTRLLSGLLMTFHSNPIDTLQRTIDVVCRDHRLSGLLLVDGAGKAITDHQAQQWWATNLAVAFLRGYFARNEHTAFDEDRFENLYRRLVAEVESPFVSVTELSPLINASLDCELIYVSPELVIRKLSIDELEEWLNESLQSPLMLMFGFKSMDPSTLDCAIEITYNKGRYEPWGAIQDINQKVSDLVSTLRLLTDREVHIAFSKETSDSVLHMGGGTFSSHRMRRHGLKAELCPSMQQDIVGTWQRIQSLQPGSATRLALRRWDMTTERLNEDDKLIDYWIALESLFTPDSKQEVKYRASFRTAAYIGDTPQEREEIYTNLKNSYDLRSKIVHGIIPKTKHKSDAEAVKSKLIGKTRSFLRRALLKILNSDQRFEPHLIESKLLRKEI